jgi:hypothetical protein
MKSIKKSVEPEREVDSDSSINKGGFYSAIIVAITTIITFGLAITATPGGVITYPYLDTLKLFPKDYIWMFVSIPLLLAYVILMVSTAASAKNDKKIFGQIGVAFAVITAVILLSDYFIQFSVIPASLINNQTEGLTLLTQYNPYGIFIALEELGYFIMSLSFLFVAPIFGKGRLESVIKWVFTLAFPLTVLSFIAITFQRGIERGDFFEIVVICITWLALLVNGALLSIYFRKRGKFPIRQAF